MKETTDDYAKRVEDMYSADVQVPQRQIDYQDIMDLGARRGEMNDSVFKRQYGYDDFWVELKLGKRIAASWDTRTRTVQIIRTDKEGTIIARMDVVSLSHLKQLIAIFGKGGVQ